MQNTAVVLKVSSDAVNCSRLLPKVYNYNGDFLDNIGEGTEINSTREIFVVNNSGVVNISSNENIFCSTGKVH